MRFSAIHKLSSYLMIASAFAALALSRELEPAIVVGVVLLGVLSYFFEPSTTRILRTVWWTRAWNAALVVVFAIIVVDAARAGDFLHAGVHFLCFLLVNKLWNRRGSRDYLQSYVISFLMLVAGAALGSELAYAGCFLAYVVFATWTLTLFHLRREMEENYLLKHSDGAQSERVEVERILNSRRIVGGSFLVGTSVVSLCVFLLATLTFFLIPRFGFGFFMQQKRRGQATIGFSDRVDLGEYGLVKDNPQVVMRVELPKRPPKGPIRLRGVSFDRYVHGHWSRTQAIPPEPLRRWDDLWLVNRDKRPTAADIRHILDETEVMNVYLDPLDTSILFGAPQPLAFQLPRNFSVGTARVELEARGGGEVIAVEKHLDQTTGRQYSAERKSGIRYTVYSDEPLPPMPLLLKLEDKRPDDPALEPYLALPADLPPRIAELARSVSAGERGPYAKAVAVERYLSKTYKYTLDLKRDPRYEPLDDFLFVERAGHCEYFASAMAVMLRTLGIPSRSVNGFLGGEWNEYGKYQAIRQGDAHSWVEVWFDGIGWMTFDPTPAAPSGSTGRGWNKLRQMLDTLELAWFKYVVEYDLGKQADAVGRVRKWAQSLGTGGGAWAAIKKHKRTLGALGALGLVIAFALSRRRRADQPRRTARAQAAHHAYEKALRALEKRGFARGEGETGRELATRVEAAGDPAAPQFSSLVELYYATRFGGVRPPPGELERLASQVARP